MANFREGLANFSGFWQNIGGFGKFQGGEENLSVKKKQAFLKKCKKAGHKITVKNGEKKGQATSHISLKKQTTMHRVLF